jgi:hypothetical protein
MTKPPTRRSALDQSCVDENIRLIDYAQKIMVAVFFGLDGIAL